VAILDARLSQFELRIIRELKPNWVKHAWQSVPVVAVIAGAMYSLLFSPIQTELVADHVHLVAHDVQVGDLKTQELRNMDTVTVLNRNLEDYIAGARGRHDDTIERLNHNTQGVVELRQKVGDIQTQQSQTAAQLNDLRVKLENSPKPVAPPVAHSRRGQADDILIPGDTPHTPVAVMQPERAGLTPLRGVDY